MVLFVDTCGAAGRVAVISTEPPGQLRAERMLPGRETQELMMGAVAEVLAQAGLTLPDLTALAVITGPGSFTGVRIGLAAVKGLAEALALPVVAISRLRWMATTAFAEGLAQKSVIAWLDAGRAEIYAGRYAQESGVVRCVTEALRTVTPPGPPGEGGLDAAEEAEVTVLLEPALAERLPGTVLLQADALRREVVRMVAGAVRDREFADPVLLDANYLRVPDAELAMLARRAAASAARAEPGALERSEGTPA